MKKLEPIFFWGMKDKQQIYGPFMRDFYKMVHEVSVGYQVVPLIPGKRAISTDATSTNEPLTGERILKLELFCAAEKPPISTNQHHSHLRRSIWATKKSAVGCLMGDFGGVVWLGMPDEVIPFIRSLIFNHWWFECRSPFEGQILKHQLDWNTLRMGNPKCQPQKLAAARPKPKNPRRSSSMSHMVPTKMIWSCAWSN